MISEKYPFKLHNLHFTFNSKSLWRDGSWIIGAQFSNDLHNLGLGMRNARLLHEDLLAKEGETILQGGWGMSLKILNFKRVPPFSAF